MQPGMHWCVIMLRGLRSGSCSLGGALVCLLRGCGELRAAVRLAINYRQCPQPFVPPRCRSALEGQSNFLNRHLSSEHSSIITVGKEEQKQNINYSA